ncbi:MAG TPA: hypothetical protein VK978_01655 [Candidatus Saccharimonadales bacterium]|nr:hypothetical protein [Candidatus Saccharimonadales bacterium]
MNIHEKPTVLVDMDGVIADFDDEALRRMSLRDPQFVRKEVRENFYIADDYPEHVDALKAISREKGFFAALPVADGALEGWQRIIDLGYHPQICTSPIRSNPTSDPEKLGWLEKHFAPIFGKHIVDEAIVTSDKHLFQGIALIDDRPVIEHSADAQWQHVLFDKPYNQNGAEPRLYGWDDEALGQLLEASRTLHASLGRTSVRYDPS